MKRDTKTDLTPLPGRALDREFALELVSALAHAEEAEVAAAGEGKALIVEAAAVVADGEDDLLGFVGKLDIDAGGGGVLEGVGDGFEGNAEEVVLDGGGQLARFASDGDFDAGGGNGIEGSDRIAERGNQAVGAGARVA